MIKNTLSFCLFCGLLVCIHSSFAQSIGGYNVYYGHLHNHTSYSDGTGSPADAYTHGRDVAGLDFMGLSEHGVMVSSSEWNALKNTANQFTDEGNFVAFWGFEWSSNLLYGHISVINTEDLTNVLSTFSFSDLKSWLNAREGIAFFNHPGREDNGLEFEHFNSAPGEQFVGMELWNKGTGFEEYYYNDGYQGNDGGLSYYDEALTRGWRIGAAGAHDHHGTSWGKTDRAMAILAPELNRPSLYAAMKARRFYSTEDRSLVMSFKLNGAEMGSTVTAGDNQTFTVQAYDEQNEVITKVQLYRNGLLFYEWMSNSISPILNKQVTTSADEYYYVKVTQVDGDEAISSPIYIDGDTGNQPPQVTLTSPESGAVFSQNATIYLTGNSEDYDGSVVRVEFYNGTQKIGEDASSPYQFTWSNVPAGTYYLSAKAIDNQGLSKLSLVSKVIIEPKNEIQMVRQISSGNDDAEEGWSSVVYGNSSDLEMVYDDWLTGNQKIGLRFTDINIPAGSEIVSASIQFTVDETSSSTTNLNIRGELSSNPVPFSGSNKVSDRFLSSTYVTWSVPAWNVAGESGAKQQTPDLKSILQEVMTQPLWKSGNAMAFIINGRGKRVAEAYEGNASQAARLNIVYTNNSSNTLLADQPYNADILVYPNPFNHQLKVLSTGELEVKVVDYTNKPMPVEVLKNVDGYIINTKEWNSGLYIITIISADETSQYRVLKK